MRIAIVIESFGGGGAERVAATWANHWAAHENEVTLLTLAGTMDDAFRLGSQIRRIGLDLPSDKRNPLAVVFNNVRRIISLRRTLRALSPEVVISLLPVANVLSLVATLGLAFPVIVSEHAHPPSNYLGRMREVARRWSYRWAAGVASLTTDSAAWLRINIPTRNVRAIPNPIVWPVPSGEPHISPHKQTGVKMMLAVGRLATEKGFDVLLTAFSRVAPAYPEWTLAILGDGPLREALEEQVLSLGLGFQVSLPGWVGNLHDWYRVADVYVMSSRTEGFGNTLAEAQAYGLPTISFDCECGPRHIIRQGIDGFLVPPNDVNALAEAMSKLMGDAALRSNLSKKAIEARERFSVNNIMARWDAWIAEVVVTRRV